MRSWPASPASSPARWPPWSRRSSGGCHEQAQEPRGGAHRRAGAPVPAPGRWPDPARAVRSNRVNACEPEPLRVGAPDAASRHPPPHRRGPRPDAATFAG
jgi:hypothetical protein